MKELIKITTNENGEKLVSARELHEFLEVKKDFTDWFKYRVAQYSLEEGVDFTTILGKSNGGRPSKEYIVTIDTAKELSMVENNDKGKQARKYFIECESKLKTLQADFSQIVSIIYGDVYTLNDAIYYLNELKNIDNSLDIDYLFKFLHQEKYLKDNQVTKLGIQKHYIIDVNGELYLSQKLLNRIISKFNKFESEELRSKSNRTSVDQILLK